MSNKIQKILKIGVPIFLLVITESVFGFEPGINDFANSYQYELYHSWLRKGNLKTDFPAGFTKDKVVKIFRDSEGNDIQVEYDWTNWKITGQREVLPFVFYADESLKIQPYISFMENFIYRLNTDKIDYLYDFIDPDKIEIQYSDLKGVDAFNMLWKDVSSRRISLEPIELFIEKDNLVFKIKPKEAEEFTIFFPRILRISEILEEIKLIEEAKSKPISEYKPKITKPIIEEVFLPEIEELTLAEYIEKYYQSPPSRELLHNKVNDVSTFLNLEFPQHDLDFDGQSFNLKIEPYENDFYGNMLLEVERNDDGVNIFSSAEYKVFNKNFSLKSGEKINISKLTSLEIEQIIPSLPQLIYEHRSIGSRLLNFLLIHDDVPTTLIVRTDKRQLYEIDSYADLLLLLNNYWQERVIYFSINEIKKIEGYIEFKGHLIASDPDSETCDLAEILFHLDKEFKIDLIMMILHPDAKLKVRKG